MSDGRKGRIGRRGWSVEQRFMAKIEKVSSGCWLWTGSCLNSGYGQFWANGKKVTAHRFSYEKVFGLVPNGYDVCHTCDTKRCVNPEHLFAASCATNLLDMKTKGRSAFGDRNGMRKHPECIARGEVCVHAKVTERTVQTIRAIYARGNIAILGLSREFGLPESTVRHIIKRDSWKHVMDQQEEI